MNETASHPDPAHQAGKDGMQPGDTARGRVTALVEFRAGDGPLIRIQPDHRLTLERAPQSVVVSWEEDGEPLNTSIPLAQFDALLDEGRIVIER